MRNAIALGICHGSERTGTTHPERRAFPLASAAMAVRVVPVPCLKDNYAYIVHADGSRRALVVDPSEDDPVAAALAREGLGLAAILDTHHHHDHVGGNEGLARRFGGVPIVAGATDEGRVPGQTRGVVHDERFEAAGLSIRALHVPGHTSGAIAYVVEGTEVFTGDTMFVAGCGRLFEGTPADMHRSLTAILGALPDGVRVWCGHEYTEANLRFAKQVDPENPAVGASIAWAAELRARGAPTVPSTIGREKAHNPFLRVVDPGFAARFGGGDPAVVLGKVRKAKDDAR
jgi:hydroxyacylglutathione hydrolase